MRNGTTRPKTISNQKNGAMAPVVMTESVMASPAPGYPMVSTSQPIR